MGGSGSGRKDKTTELLNKIAPKKDLNSQQKFAEKMTEIGIQVQQPFAGAFMPNPGGASSSGGAETDPLSLHLAGAAGGQLAYGGTAQTDGLTLISTDNVSVTYPSKIKLYGDTTGGVDIFGCSQSQVIEMHNTDGLTIATGEKKITIEAGGGADIYFKTDKTYTTKHFCPTGSIIMYGGVNAPAGFLLCDGAAVRETTYAALFAVIGHDFGDPGEGHFSVPNMQLKFPMGTDTGGVSPIGTTGGSTDYTPEGAIDAHTYTSEQGALGGMLPTYVNGPLIHTFTGTAATIEPPYLTLNFIIKY